MPAHPTSLKMRLFSYCFAFSLETSSPVAQVCGGLYFSTQYFKVMPCSKCTGGLFN
jgi:hypothetical protein